MIKPKSCKKLTSYNGSYKKFEKMVFSVQHLKKFLTNTFIERRMK